MRRLPSRHFRQFWPPVLVADLPSTRRRSKPGPHQPMAPPSGPCHLDVPAQVPEVPPPCPGDLGIAVEVSLARARPCFHPSWVVIILENVASASCPPPPDEHLRARRLERVLSGYVAPDSMPRRKRSRSHSDDPDAPSSPDHDEISDVDDSGHDLPPAATGVENPDAAGSDDEDLDAAVDVEDQIELFGGNLHPPEYYSRAMEVFNQDDYESEDYKTGTTLLLDSVEGQWFRFCDEVVYHDKEVKPPPSYELVSLSRLHSFFK
ncbi:hypothetical protein F5Y16DRAFT_407002 [Xylariaceae sp. FL0255]|nr:hypothetical protein F5Y16DRAFT_407002 [Xylariaceae sp. FL0255]